MIDQEKPNVQTRLNIPGVNVFPKIDYYNGEHNARIKENENIPFFWDSSDQQSYSFYEQLITAEKNKYDDLASLAGNNVIPVEWSELGECGIAPFAWDTSEPCVFLRLNRVSLISILYLPLRERVVYLCCTIIFSHSTNID